MEGVKNEHRQRRILQARQILAELIEAKTNKKVIPEMIKTTKFVFGNPWRFVPKPGSPFPEIALSSLSKENLIKIQQAIETNSVDVVWKDPGVEPESTLVNIQVPLASISQYTSAQTQVMQRRLEELTEENERLKILLVEQQGMKEELERLGRERDGMKEEIERLEQENIGVKEEIERLEWENKAMKDKLQIISGLLNE
ncbi:hypothetical protein BGX38DRAFT_1277172 [Terfezia claveryi]|nr:hypothetical protein BGX38DRAFT_1277172 [Terfezia claveryi]